MSKTLSLTSMAIALAFPVFAATYYVDGSVASSGDGTSWANAVKTIAEGVAKATTADDVVEVAAGTYTISSQISVSKAITIHGASRATTIIDANKTCRIFNVTAAATIESFTLYRGMGSAAQSGSGAYFTKAGTLRDCLVDSCFSPSQGGAVNGVGVYLSGGAVAENCIIRNTQASLNAAIMGIGVYINDGTLRDSLVTRSRRTGYDKADTGAVYLQKGTVERCTIAGNTVGYSGGLHVNNASTCVVRDTIVWGNTTTRDSSRLRPNMNAVGSNCVLENVCTSGNVGTGGVDANPCFRDAANWDFALLPGSPCIGAGTNGRDLGYLQHDPAADALGISISAYRGRGSLEVTAKLSASGAYSLAGATVTWDGLTETGTTITHTFGFGTHSLTANVTFADNSTATVTLPNAVKVTVGEVYVDDDSENPVAPYTTPETAARTLADAFTYLDDTNAVVYVAEGTYTISSQMILTSRRKVVATGDRDQTILQKSGNDVRFFHMCGTGAEVTGLTLDGRNYTSGSLAGAIWMTSSGTISNCVVRNCKSSSNADGGGLYLTAGTIVHCVIRNCMGYTYAKGAGVYLEGSAVIRDSVVANCGNSGKRTATNNKGGGVYLKGTSKALNCTIVGNTSCTGGGVFIEGSDAVVANCIIYGNDEGGADSTGKPDWYGTASRFVNCCAKVAANGTCVAVSSSPVAADFTIDATTGADCINGGDNSYVVTTADVFGNPRIVNGTVDIGAAEYASVEVVPGFQADVLRGLAPLKVVFSGTVQGIDPDGAVFSWYFDGGETPAGIGQTFTNVFGVGYHTVRAVVSKDGSDHATDWSAADYILALPQHMYVATNAASAFPYDTPETAATNIHTVVDLAREADGISITVGPGRYLLKKTILIDRARTTLAGAGMDATILYHNTQGISLLHVNSLGGLVSDLCLSNGLGHAAGLYLYGAGGHVTRCLITNCKGPTNNAGGGAHIDSTGARLSRCIIRNCRADTTNAGSQTPFGAGLYLESGFVDDCLITGNQAEAGGGAYIAGGTMANCVVTGNTAWNMSGARTFCAGGVYATGGTVLNCIVFGNSTNGGAVNDTPVANVSGIGYCSHCCLPAVFAGQGTATIATDDPCFKNAARGDYRITGASPCRDKGLYQSWMADAVDFFGNPRARGTHVDIGYHQSEPAGTTIFLR
jgi:hypothetical protein